MKKMMTMTKQNTMKNLFFTLALFCLCAANAQTKKWTLKECVSYALSHNISIQQSELDLKNAEIDLKGAKGNFLPNLNASLGHSWNNGLSRNETTGLLETATNQNSSFGINAGITIYDGLKNTRQLHKANLAILANQYQLEDMKDNISLRVVNAFLQVLFNQESLKTLNRQYELSKKEFLRTQELIEAETKPKGDILEIEAAMAGQEQQIVNTQNTIQIAIINLTNLLLIKDYKTFEIADRDYDMSPSNVLTNNAQEIYSKALTQRNDIKATETQVKISEDDLKIAKGNYKPTLSGSYGFGTNYFNSELTVNPSLSNQLKNNKSHRFGLNLSIPIFNRYSISNGVKRSKIFLEKSKLALEQSKVDLRDKVNQAYNNVEGAFTAFNAAKKTLAARKQAFLYSKDKFDVGLMNSFDFSQSKTRFETAENEVIRAKYDYFFKVKVLEFYFGIPLNAE
jgi:outer membrane protein